MARPHILKNTQRRTHSDDMVAQGHLSPSGHAPFSPRSLHSSPPPGCRSPPRPRQDHPLSWVCQLPTPDSPALSQCYHAQGLLALAPTPSVRVDVSPPSSVAPRIASDFTRGLCTTWPQPAQGLNCSTEALSEFWLKVKKIKIYKII